jgi:hypothetical protein
MTRTPLRADVQPAGLRMRWACLPFANRPCQFFELDLGATSYRRALVRGYSRRIARLGRQGQLPLAPANACDLRAGHFAKRLQAIDKLWRCLGPL